MAAVRAAFRQNKKDALAIVLFGLRDSEIDPPVLLGFFDLRQRDGLLAILLGDHAFGIHLYGIMADCLVEAFRDGILVGEDHFWLAVFAGDGDGGLTSGGDLQITFSAGGDAIDFGRVIRVQRKAESGEDNSGEECDFFHVLVFGGLTTVEDTTRREQRTLGYLIHSEIQPSNSRPPSNL